MSDQKEANQGNVDSIGNRIGILVLSLISFSFVVGSLYAAYVVYIKETTEPGERGLGYYVAIPIIFLVSLNFFRIMFSSLVNREYRRKMLNIIDDDCCPECGYDLRGLVRNDSSECPECGHSIGSSQFSSSDNGVTSKSLNGKQ